MPLHYYDPDNMQEYKKLKKNFKKEMSKPKPTFENNLNCYQEEKKDIKQHSPNPQYIRPKEKPINHNNDDEEIITYQIVKNTKQAQLSKLGRKRRLFRNIIFYLAIFTIIVFLGLLYRPN